MWHQYPRMAEDGAGYFEAMSRTTNFFAEAIMQTELTLLRREVRVLKLCLCCLAAVLAVLLIAAFRGGKSEDQVIRARGLIIVDAAGHERILLGAPLPAARNRVRTDSA